MNKKSFVYISTYEGSAGSGIYCSTLNNKDGVLSPFRKVADVSKAGLMVLHPQKKVLYIVGIKGLPEKNTGCIATYIINEITGDLSLLHFQETGSGLPTFITTSVDGHFLFQVSFSSASGSVLGIKENGSLQCIDKVHTFSGSGPNPVRQTRSNPHCINMHPNDDVVFVCDLGADQIIKFFFKRERNSLVRAEQILPSVNAGAGPRILRFSEDGKNVYVINELDNTITIYHYDPVMQILEPIQVVSTLPDSITKGFDKQMAGEIRLHPNQQYVYASNRSTGDGTIDGIIVFERSIATGILTPLQFCATGKHPRHFNIDPEGKWLFVAARDADQIHIFSIDQNNGILKEAGSPIFFKQPWDIQFYTI